MSEYKSILEIVRDDSDRLKAPGRELIKVFVNHELTTAESMALMVIVAGFLGHLCSHEQEAYEQEAYYAVAQACMGMADAVEARKGKKQP